jgi:hypothetical protein
VRFDETLPKTLAKTLLKSAPNSYQARKLWTCDGNDIIHRTTADASAEKKFQTDLAKFTESFWLHM